MNAVLHPHLHISHPSSRCIIFQWPVATANHSQPDSIMLQVNSSHLISNLMHFALTCRMYDFLVLEFKYILYLWLKVCCFSQRMYTTWCIMEREPSTQRVVPPGMTWKERGPWLLLLVRTLSVTRYVHVNKSPNDVWVVFFQEFIFSCQPIINTKQPCHVYGMLCD